jgi:hypothetical protein
VSFDIAGDPTPEEAAAIVAALGAAFSSTAVAATASEPSKWRAAARELDDRWANDRDLLRLRTRGSG